MRAVEFMRNGKVKQPSPLTSGEIDKMRYTHRGLLLVSLKEEENVNIHCNMDEPWGN